MSTEPIAVDGILLLDKPSGPSSNHALQRVKRALHAAKAGHVGTLDPLASGLLPIVLGEGTKFASFLLDADKAYDATLQLGVTTSTGDIEGAVIARRPSAGCDERIESAIAAFRGAISQMPPMYSALKVGGKPLYLLARQGKVVERRARDVRIDELVIVAVRDSEVDLRIRCSKGTYIRVLAQDIGEALGCGATLRRLRRTAVGGFSIDAATSLQVIEADPATIPSRSMLAIDAALAHLPALTVEPALGLRIRAGQRVTVPEFTPAGVVRLYDRGTGEFFGLGEVDRALIAPVRLTANAADRLARSVASHKMT